LETTKRELAEAKVRNIELQRQLASQDPRVSWTHLGNGEQFRFNCTVLNTLTEASTALEEDSTVEAKALVKSAVGKITYRNKIVKLADNSQAGWGFVDEYEQLDLADSAEDDQRIRRAEQSAIAKRKRKLEASQRGGKSLRGGKPSRGRGGYAGASQAVEFESDPLSWFLQQFAVHATAAPAVQAAAPAAVAAPAPAPAAAQAPYPKKQLGPCYYCGGPHLQSQCAAYKAQQALLKAHREHRDQMGDGNDDTTNN
jgi:hypothetical protein